MSDNFVELDEAEVVITESEELLLRQITEHLWDDKHGLPSSTSFGPTNIDKGMPSFARNSVVDAQASRDWHNKHAKSRSIGVWAVSIAAVVEAGTRAIDDTQTPLAPGQVRSPGHAFVDYRHMLSDKSAQRRIRAKLLMDALDRGEIPTTESSRQLEAQSPDAAISS